MPGGLSFCDAIPVSENVNFRLSLAQSWLHSEVSFHECRNVLPHGTGLTRSTGLLGGPSVPRIWTKIWTGPAKATDPCFCFRTLLIPCSALRCNPEALVFPVERKVLGDVTGAEIGGCIILQD